MTPEKIVHRDEIVRLQSQKTQVELVDVCRVINQRLKAAPQLPVIFLEKEFGSTEWVRRDVENRLRDAGWKVNSVVDKGGPNSYQVQ